MSVFQVADFSGQWADFGLNRNDDVYLTSVGRRSLPKPKSVNYQIASGHQSYEERAKLWERERLARYHPAQDGCPSPQCGCG